MGSLVMVYSVQMWMSAVLPPTPASAPTASVQTPLGAMNVAVGREVSTLLMRTPALVGNAQLHCTAFTMPHCGLCDFFIPLDFLLWLLISLLFSCQYLVPGGIGPGASSKIGGMVAIIVFAFLIVAAVVGYIVYKYRIRVSPTIACSSLPCCFPWVAHNPPLCSGSRTWTQKSGPSWHNTCLWIVRMRPSTGATRMRPRGGNGFYSRPLQLVRKVLMVCLVCRGNAIHRIAVGMKGGCELERRIWVLLFHFLVRTVSYYLCFVMYNDPGRFTHNKNPCLRVKGQPFYALWHL